MASHEARGASDNRSPRGDPARPHQTSPGFREEEPMKATYLQRPKDRDRRHQAGTRAAEPTAAEAGLPVFLGGRGAPFGLPMFLSRDAVVRPSGGPRAEGPVSRPSEPDERAADRIADAVASGARNRGAGGCPACRAGARCAACREKAGARARRGIRRRDGRSTATCGTWPRRPLGETSPTSVRRPGMVRMLDCVQS
jgi:hypothetical protein